MEHYQLGETCTVEASLFADMHLDDSVVHMKVQGQSRMQNLLGFALNKVKLEDVKQIVWYAEGSSTRKATNCAEIMKKKQKNLYMLSRKGYKRVEEYWEPIYPDSGLDRLKVNRDTDAVSILLSKLPLVGYEGEPGYLGLEDVPVRPPVADHSLHKSNSKAKNFNESSNKRHNRPRTRQKSEKSTSSHPSNNNSSTQTKISEAAADSKSTAQLSKS